MRGELLRGNALRDDQEGQVWGRGDVWDSPEPLALSREEPADPGWAG